MSTPIVSRDVMSHAAMPLPVALIFDWSWSMREHTGQILEALRGLPAEFSRSSILRHSAEVALITMGVPKAEYTAGHQVVLRTGDPDEPPFGFRRMAAFTPPPKVECDGTTELDVALNLAVDLLERRLKQIAEAGRSPYRPYVAIVSDGAPTDAEGGRDDAGWREASRRLRAFLDGRLMVEAFVPKNRSAGILPEIIGDGNEVREFDPANLAQVIHAISSSVRRAADGNATPLDRIRKDIEDREGAS